MASQERQPKPKGESDCSRPTATVPVTSFIDVMRNADQNRSRGSLCCSVRMRSSNADSASQASRELPPLADPAITGGHSVITDEHPAITGGVPSFQTGPPSFRRKPESRGDGQERGSRSRSERSFLISEYVVSTSSCGDGHSVNAGLKNQVMTGGDIEAPHGGPTVWRRRRRWTL